VNSPLDTPPGADEPMDRTDFAVVDAVADLFDTVDPVPAGLVGRITFAMALDHLDAEVSRMSEQRDSDLALARGEERSRTITFESVSLTVMITVTEAPDGRLRFDGWCVPTGPHHIELRTDGGLIRADADDQGRFVVPRVPAGLAQLVIRLAAEQPAAPARSVITPAIVV
jgi:hypothetical protein